MKNLVTIDKSFMNTTITFKVVKTGTTTISVQNAIEEGFGEFDRIVKKYTRFNENSELSNLNRQSRKWVKVSTEFFSLIEAMLELSNATKGAFDPTVIDFLEAYGYDKNYDFSMLNNPKLDNLVKNLAKSRPSWKEIKMDKHRSRVKLAKGQKVDLGGIGKGYAIDCAKSKFLDHGVKNFLIDAGGDIYANGKNENGKYWQATLRIIDQDGKLRDVGNIELRNEALACSGSWARKVKQFHHIINTTDGKPENSKSTVFVKAPTATIADGWATALFVNKNQKIKLPSGITYLEY